MDTHTPVFSVQEVLQKGLDLTKKYWMQYFILVVGIVVIAIAINLLSIFSSSEVWNFIVQILSLGFSVVAAIAMIRLSLQAVDGVDPKAIDFKALVTRDWKLVLFVLGTMILYGIAVFAGLIFFIIPGIIFGLIFMFATFTAIEKGLNPLEAMQASYKMTQGNLVPMFLFGIAVFALQFVFVAFPLLFLLLVGLLVGEDGAILVLLVAVLALVPMFIASVILKMISGFGTAYMYRKLSHAHPEALKVEAPAHVS
jgi:hypothetical protein